MADIRWQQRYHNYKSMVLLLEENAIKLSTQGLNNAEEIGMAKMFELSFELMWKLFKDYLEHLEVEIGIVSPKNIIQTMASSTLLEKLGVDGDILMEAHKARNALVHIYDKDKFEDLLLDISDIYLPQLLTIEQYFSRLQDAK